MTEALFYNKLENKTVQCVLCPHNCMLNDNHYGLCNSRKNINGNLIATSYGNLCAIGIDPVEKKPLMQFLSGSLTYSISSAGCNLRCQQCQNDNISQFKPENRLIYKLNPIDIVKDCKEKNCASISYTYTEPITFYEFMIDTAKLANNNNLKNIMVSNGYINEEPLHNLCNYIDAFNIDLKYWNDDTYRKMSGGSLKYVLKTLKIIKEHNKWLEITNLIIPDVNDNMNEIKNMCMWLVDNGFENYPLHFTRFYPRFKMMEKSWTSIQTIYEAEHIAKNIGIKNVYLGNM